VKRKKRKHFLITYKNGAKFSAVFLWVMHFLITYKNGAKFSAVFLWVMNMDALV